MSTPTPNDLGTVVTSDKARRIIYSVYVIAVVVIGAVQVAYAGAQVTPEWVTITQQVLLYLGVPVGGLAAVNTKRGKYAAE
jgi:ACR3 family arsenite efflux pump ArsB